MPHRSVVAKAAAHTVPIQVSGMQAAAGPSHRPNPRLIGAAGPQQQQQQQQQPRTRSWQKPISAPCTPWAAIPGMPFPAQNNSQLQCPLHARTATACHRGSSKTCIHSTSATVSPSSHEPEQGPESSSSSGPVPASHWVDQLSESERTALADQWGFSFVGMQLPAGIRPDALHVALPPEVLQFSIQRAWAGLAAPLALMAAGYGWMCYWHGIVPLWQQLFCWLAIGTGYTGLFTIAHECARGTFLPQFPDTQNALGALIMAPSLFSLDSWRVRIFHHHNTINRLGADTTAWHPLTLEELREAGPLRRAFLRLFAGTPLKLLSSVAEWARGLQGWDLNTYYEPLRERLMISWMAPAVWLGLCLPLMVVLLGDASGLWTHWLAPLLVFHGWLSTLTLLHHTAPQVPWRFTGQHDLGQAIISGTVTVQMPAWLEALLNYPNYSLPQHLMFNGVPFYHAKAATQALREKLWPYMQEATLSLKLMKNHVNEWQVYDEFNQRYITWEAALQALDEQPAAPEAFAR